MTLPCSASNIRDRRKPDQKKYLLCSHFPGSIYRTSQKNGKAGTLWKTREILSESACHRHTFLKTDFIAELDKAARKEGYSIVVFNSSMDYYWEQSGSNISGRIYELIRYDKLAAVVILSGDLHDTQLQEEIIHNANIRKIPVIWQGGTHPGCISIRCDYEDAYKSIIHHVVRDHKAADAFFLAWIKDEVNSQLRLRFWQEVMTEEGLPCGEDRVA